MPVGPGIHRIAIGGYWKDEVDDSPFVTVELAAPDADAAERRVQRLVSEALRAGGLRTKRIFPVVWVTPLRSAGEDGHRFLSQAKELFDSEQYELAVIAAQVHFELQLRLLLERAAARSDSSWARRLIKNRRVGALRNDVSKATVELLLGVDVTQNKQLWPLFTAHIERRNAVAHEGAAVSSRDAAASIKSVQAMWAFLAEAERSTTLF